MPHLRIKEQKEPTPTFIHSYGAHALDEFPKDHPGHDPGVPVYTAATACVRETEMGAPTSGPHWQTKIDEQSLLKRLTGEK